LIQKVFIETFPQTPFAGILISILDAENLLN